MYRQGNSQKDGTVGTDDTFITILDDMEMEFGGGFGEAPHVWVVCVVWISGKN